MSGGAIVWFGLAVLALAAAACGVPNPSEAPLSRTNMADDTVQLLVEAGPFFMRSTSNDAEAEPRG